VHRPPCAPPPLGRPHPNASCTHPCHLAVPLFPAAAPTPTRVATSLSLSHAAAPPPAPWLPSRHSYTESPTPRTSVPGPGTAEASFKAGSEFAENHGKLLGGAATVLGVVAVVVGQVTANTVHMKAEARRVEELHKVVMKSEARRLEDLTKVEARVSKGEARRLEDLVKHEVAQRKEVMLRQAAQSEAANRKSEADMFRVLAGAEHQDAVEMTKKKNMR
jgi:hypothetical protein